MASEVAIVGLVNTFGLALPRLCFGQNAVLVGAMASVDCKTDFTRGGRQDLGCLPVAD